MSEQVHMVCSPVQWGPSNIDGSTIATCTLCDQDVHLAPASIWLLEQHPGAAIACIPCAADKLPPPDEVRFAPEQLEEVVRNLTRPAKGSKGPPS